MKSRLLAVLVVVGAFVVLHGCGSDAEGNGGNGGTKMDTLPEIEAAPTQLTFTALPPGQSQKLSLKIRNTGAGDDLKIHDVYVRDLGVPYTFSEPGSTVVPEGEETSIDVTYTATAVAPLPSVLVIESNAATEPDLEIPLTVAEGVGGLTIYPNPVDFGKVLGGESKLVHLTINNSDSTTVSLTNAFFLPESSEDFDTLDPPDFPLVLDPNTNGVIDLTYTPVGGGPDDGILALAFNKNGAQSLSEIPLYGTEVGPEINISPPKIELGFVAMGSEVSQTVEVHNMGEHDLKIKKVYAAPLTNPDVSIPDAPTGTVVVASAAKTTVTVKFKPQQFFATTMDPIGDVVIESNDPDETIVNVPVYANIDAPFIKLDPPGTVDFGIVAQSWTIERKLQIDNVGHSPLTVSLLEITANTPSGEFLVVADENFPPTTGEGTEIVMPGEPKTITLSFSNKGGATGQEKGKLHIVSDDPLTPDVYVDLVATRGGNPECKLGFVPNILEFMTVAHGATKQGTIFLKNVGSGYCSFVSGMIHECGSWMGMMTTCSDTGGPSPYFKPLTMPMGVKDGIAPGTSTPIQVLYTPPTNIPWIPLFEDYYGALQITYTEPYSVPNTYTQHKYPAGNNGALNFNIHGKSGVADIAVLPPEIDFGLVTIGCYSNTVCVRIYNAGTAPLQVSDIYLDGCGTPSEFQLKEFPPLPMDIGESKYQEACLVYFPQNEGSDSCKMMIESSDMDTPTLAVPLAGEGTWETENTDIFAQISGKKVDILFVVDGSPSMCGELDNVKQNFNELTAIAAQWGNDYQIGVTSLDLEDPDVAGKLEGSPKIITKDSVDKFGENVNAIGCDKSSGGQEAGLEAGRKALTPPFLGNENAGFLRKDAALEVVFVSDEEDQSPGDVPFYVDFYKSIKGFLNTEMFHAHAIVGDKGGGCTVSSSDGADGGDRYIAVQEATKGVFGSICDESFEQVLQDIGNKAFGLQVQFFLSAQADKNNVKVWINGVLCQDGWSYDPATNSILFAEDGPCMPDPGDEVKVWYQMVCNAQ